MTKLSGGTYVPTLDQNHVLRMTLRRALQAKERVPLGHCGPHGDEEERR